jgi:mRNA interferase MazF
MVNYIPDRGDIVWLNFEPQKGNEITKTRPALVISPKKYNAKINLGIFMPITSHVKGYPFEVEVNINNTAGAILCDQIRSLDWKERKAVKMSRLDQKLLDEAISKLRLLLEG